MVRKVLAAMVAGTLAITLAVSAAMAGGSSAKAPTYEPVLHPSNFVKVVNNRYFPLPVGRVLTYRGKKDGKAQIDRMEVTHDTKVIEGITATVVTDVAKHGPRLLEKTEDWYAQDKQGNVWYLGEDTAAYGPGGSVDTSGSWQAGVHDAEPGIIMPADPQIPNGYRQEYLAGQAEDTAWTVDRGGSVTVPYGSVHDVLTSLEATHVEPGSYDQKIYAPGIGVVLERSLTEMEFFKLVSVKN